MTYDPNGQLWRRGMGIRFSPKPKTQPYNPPHNARFLHGDAEPEDPRPSSAAIETLSQTARQERSLADGSSTTRPVDEPVNASLESPRPADNVAGRSQPAVVDGFSELSAIETIDPPSTSLQYQISPESFQNARKSAEGSPASFWSHTMYRSLQDDGAIKNVKVHYCTSKKTMDFVCQKYFLGEDVLGFDLEWSPWATKAKGPRENVSLIQIASPSRIGLFHCALFAKDDFVAPTFKDIMEDPNVKKVGVAIKADCTRLKNYLGVDARGIMELSHLYKVVRYTKEKQPNKVDKSLVSLANLAKEYLRLPLYKGASVRESNWSRVLNGQQITYSASDAYAGLQLYHVLDEERLKLDPCPPRPYPAELGMPLPVPIVNIDKKGQNESDWETVSTSDSSLSDSSDSDSGNDSGAESDARDERIIAAEMKMLQYRSSRRRPVSVGPSALRTYYIWYGNEDLKPEAIAKLLREPPLQTHTVISYILNSVMNEDMPYSKSRIRDELIPFLNPAATKGPKYQALLKACQETASNM